MLGIDIPPATDTPSARSGRMPQMRDWAMVSVLVPAVIMEAALRHDVVYPVVAAVAGTLMVFASAWRRTYPLYVLVAAFTVIIGTDVVAVTRVGRPVVLYTGLVVVVLLIHALFRWGSPLEIVIGIGVLIAATVESQIVEFRGFANVLLAVFVGIATAELGWLVRSYYIGQEERRRMDRMRDRERLARELHDTVAHRVSAITISAQAGKVRSKHADPSVVASFDEIEREAKRAMAEMRLIVGRYRDDGEALPPDGSRPEGSSTGTAPSGGNRLTLRHISRLARESTHPTVHVDVELSGDLDNVDGCVESTAYRLAQESITNALRHAHNATRVDVVVVGEPDTVRLTVRDDGDAVTTVGPDGFGLVGMNERVELVGGTLVVGPDPVKGWRVEAELPKKGGRS